MITQRSIPTHFFTGQLMLLTALASSSAAQAPSSPRPVKWAASDPGLTWAPCPPVFPAGCEVAILDGDPASGPSDVFLRTPPNYTFPAHRHTSAEHLVLISGVLHVTYIGPQVVELRSGTYALVPAKASHKAHCANSGPCVMFIRFDVPIDAEVTNDIP